MRIAVLSCFSRSLGHHTVAQDARRARIEFSSSEAQPVLQEITAGSL